MRSNLISLILAILIAVFTLGNIVSAQQQMNFTSWSCYGSDSTNGFKNVIRTNDGGYLYVGYDKYPFHTNYDAWVVKTDSSDCFQWNHYFPGLDDEYAMAAVQASNGNFYIAGYAEDQITHQGTAMSWCCDSFGNAIWSRQYGVDSSMFNSIVLTPDNSLLIVGLTTVNNNNCQLYVIKTDLDGVEQWSHNFGGNGYDEGKKVIMSSNNYYYVIAGQSAVNSTSLGNAATWRVTPSGSLYSFNTYGYDGIECANSITQMWDGGYLLVGMTTSYSPDATPQVLTIKLSPAMAMQSYNHYLYNSEATDVCVVDYQAMVVGNQYPHQMDFGGIFAMGTGLYGDSSWWSGYGQIEQYYEAWGVAGNGVTYRVAGQRTFDLDTDGLSILLESSHPEVYLNPGSVNITIPPWGGSFNFDMYLHNPSNLYANIDLWMDIVTPGGGTIPLSNRDNIGLTPWGWIVRNDLTQVVPPSAPPGNYLLKACIREHGSWIVLDESEIPFTKLAGDNRGQQGDWKLYGLDLDGEATAQLSNDKALFAYPNPFNPTTTISYTLPQAGMVNLSIFDINGRQVATLVTGTQEAGAHQATFDGSRLSSGIYLYRLQTDFQSATGKMMLVK